MGLNSRQIEMLATAIPKRQYYYTSPLGRRLISLGLGPVALAFTGTAGREAMTTANTLAATHGPAWPAEWLRTRGLTEAADRWRRLSEEDD
jgi:type IV secretion system protein VirB4